MEDCPVNRPDLGEKEVYRHDNQPIPRGIIVIIEKCQIDERSYIANDVCPDEKSFQVEASPFQTTRNPQCGAHLLPTHRITLALHALDHHAFTQPCICINIVRDRLPAIRRRSARASIAIHIGLSWTG